MGSHRSMILSTARLRHFKVLMLWYTYVLMLPESLDMDTVVRREQGLETLGDPCEHRPFVIVLPSPSIARYISRDTGCKSAMP